ncbi:MAG: LytS/YhcK type 5TM receptor domain-containing protein, partial [Pseudomonadota bacterium]
MLVLLQIVENILLLSLMGLGAFLVERFRPTLGNAAANVLGGVCFGVTAALVTATPVAVASSAILDTRAGPLLLAGLLGGPAGGAVAALIGVLAQGYGDSGWAASSLVVFFAYAALGALLRRTRLVDMAAPITLGSVSIVLFASYLGALTTFFVIRSRSAALDWLLNELPLVVFANTFSVAFSALSVGVALTVV